MAAVSSLESSTTTIWSTSPSSRSGSRASRIGPIVRASSRAGRQTDTEAGHAAASDSGLKSVWAKLRRRCQARARRFMVRTLDAGSFDPPADGRRPYLVSEPLPHRIRAGLMVVGHASVLDSPVVVQQGIRGLWVAVERHAHAARIDQFD